MIWAGFLIGLMGSLHCIGMCGPIALSLPMANDKNRLLGIFLYNMGRVFMYSFLGILFGLIGYVVVLSGFQQLLSIVAGVFLLLLIFIPMISIKLGKGFGFLTYLSNQFRRIFSSLIKQPTYTSLFLIGVLNGLLPCGLVYIAFTGAIATGDLFSGSLFMALFGLGTMPAMIMVGFWRNLILPQMRDKIKKIVPFTLTFMALLLILRGLNLGIPYVSPSLSGNQKMGYSSTLKCH